MTAIPLNNNNTVQRRIDTQLATTHVTVTKSKSTINLALTATLVMHCVVHGQHLVAECISDKLNVSLQYVIREINN